MNVSGNISVKCFLTNILFVFQINNHSYCRIIKLVKSKLSWLKVRERSWSGLMQKKSAVI